MESLIDTNSELLESSFPDPINPKIEYEHGRGTYESIRREFGQGAPVEHLRCYLAKTLQTPNGIAKVSLRTKQQGQLGTAEFKRYGSHDERMANSFRLDTVVGKRFIFKQNYCYYNDVTYSSWFPNHNLEVPPAAPQLVLQEGRPQVLKHLVRSHTTNERDFSH